MARRSPSICGSFYRDERKGYFKMITNWKKIGNYKWKKDDKEIFILKNNVRKHGYSYAKYPYIVGYKQKSYSYYEYDTLFKEQTLKDAYERIKHYIETH